MKPHVFQKAVVINRNINTVFNFFSNAENLNKITPAMLGFKMITKPPFEMKVGTLIDYQIKLYGIPFRWKSKITKWNPPFMFEDTQIKGPYKIWIHEHRFEERGESTLVTDTVNYLSPGWKFEFIPHRIFVEKKVEEIFNYREKVLLELFAR